MKLRLMLVAVSANFLSGCASSSDVQTAVSGLAAGLRGTVPAAAPSLAETTPLSGVFNRSDGQWPRVALTIHSLPRDAYVAAMGSQLPPSYCMQVSAVVWSSPKESKTVPQHSFCLAQAPQRWVNFGSGDFLLWSMTANTSANTGSRRSNGPQPPMKNFPEGAKYANFAQGRGGNLFAALLSTMNYDMTLNPSSDRRLWVVSLPSQTEL